MSAKTSRAEAEPTHRLDPVRFELDPAPLLAKVRLEGDAGYRDEVARLLAEAGRLARPTALYRLAYPQLVDAERVIIGGVELRSRVLRVNLSAAQRVFVYVATCGPELDEWAHAKDDPLERYLAEAIKEAALGTAIRALNRDIQQRYRPGPTAAMAPGSLADWPIQQQRPLFAILGDVPGRIGVQLSPSYVMIPNKSVSGIRFPRQESFESCMLCPRPDCPNRRAPYDPGLYARRYAAS